MSCNGSDRQPVCPCGQFVFPVAITNPPGLDTIAYRAGDYTSFRHALLLPRAGETQLTQTSGTQVTQIWRPGAQSDLAVQMIEWWAYLCDVLTFYNERVANQAYLRTADRPESVNRLIYLLGYRPRPGIGATGVLAALATGPNAFTLPTGFQVQSKPGPGQQPQVFELEEAVTITPPAGPPDSPAVQGTAAATPPLGAAPMPGSQSPTVVLQGTISALKAGDRVLLLPIPSATPAPGFALATVAGIAPEKDALGDPVTKVTLTAITTYSTGTDASQYQLLRTDLSCQVWQYPADPSSVFQWQGSALQIDLATIVRGLQPGDPIVIESPGTSPQGGSLISSTEVVWFANPSGYIPPNQVGFTSINPAVPPPPPASPPNAPPPIAIPIPHTRITLQGLPPTSLTQPSTTPNVPPNCLVRYGWRVVGNLIAEPMAQVASSGNSGGSGAGGIGGSASPPVTLNWADGSQIVTVPNQPVLVQDVNGNGAAGFVSPPSTVQLTGQYPSLVPPLQVLFNLLRVTRGKTVPSEVLGSGNALVAGQDFVLQKAPVTYLQDPNSLSGDNYSSTVRVWVNQLEWSEVRSFYGQSAMAQVFLTYEDEQGNTHVRFGDGQNGARLPTGVNNITATYRYGSGATVPAAGSLTVVLQPQPGLRAIANPVAVAGGSDPDAPTDVRQLAPRSVLTLNRAVSVDDYEAIVAAAPNVARAKAAVAFDPIAQRPRITVWVGDDSGAVDAAVAALAATADPNRLPQVQLAQAVVMTLSLTFVYDPKYQPAAVQQALQTALIDPDAGLLGATVVSIGEVFYDSQLYQACLAVPGVVAVHSLSFSSAVSGISSPRHDPGPGGYLSLDAQNLTLTSEAAS